MFVRCFDQAWSYSAGRGGWMAEIYQELQGASRQQLVLCQAAKLEWLETKLDLAGGTGEGEWFFLYDCPMVWARGHVPEVSAYCESRRTSQFCSFWFNCKTVFPPVPVPSLCSHICTTSFSLPEIQDELEKSIYTTREAFRQLPREPSQQPVNEVATLLHEFVTDLARHIAGVPDEKGLIQSFRPAQDRFRREIRLTAPRFRPYEKRFSTCRQMSRATFLDHECDVSENDDHEGDSRKPKGYIVHVDEVFERAQWYAMMCLNSLWSITHLSASALASCQELTPLLFSNPI